jgi:hypothetical protein
MNIYITDTFTFIFLVVHINSLCACWHPEAMKGSSSSSSCRLLILPCITSSLSSLVWTQLTLLVPALRIRSPLPQNGAPIHRVRAHSLTGIQNNDVCSAQNRPEFSVIRSTWKLGLNMSLKVF